MTERHLQEDEAARYVLGQLPPAEQNEFEAQLAQSAELRALVQELEQGVEALARAVPQRPPPPQTWSHIEQSIAQAAEEKIVTPALWSNWWRNGWAAAAACLLGWLGYALWNQRSEVHSEVATLAPTVNVIQTPALGAAGSNQTTSLPNSDTVTASANREQVNLRRQVATLQTQVQQLSQIAIRQQAIMAEPGRFKMFPLATNVTRAGNAAVPPLSPELQRALFYAMARELGWLPAPTPGETQNTPVANTATNHPGVDFVDLTPTNDPPATVKLQESEAESLEQVQVAPASVGSSGNIPGFQSGTNLVLAFDASVVPNGSAVAFWVGNQWIGGTVTGDNPTVVTIPTATSPGWNLTITANSSTGSSNVIGQFYTH